MSDNAPEVDVPRHADLPPCHSRRDHNPSEGQYFCAHPFVHSDGDLVTAGICLRCSRWQDPPPSRFKAFPAIAGRREPSSCLHLGDQTGLRECPSCGGNVKLKVFECHHPDYRETTLDECRFCPEYEPPLVPGGIRTWCVGMTTAPRTKPTLERSLLSIQAAGWPDVRIFAEPRVAIPRAVATSPITWRESTTGAWPNWYLALTELYLRDPLADAYGLFQDDALVCRGTRAYLERVLWPERRLGFVSLYNPIDESYGEPKFRRLPSETLLPGAVALIFPNASARLLLADSRTLAHRRRGASDGMAHVDAVISKFAKRRGLSQWMHSPSLAQHIGDTTTLEGTDARLRQAGSFVGVEFDARSWIVKENSPGVPD